MDKTSEIINRWFRVFEKQTHEDQKKVLDTFDSKIVASDVRFLIDSVKKLEERLGFALNQHSSSIGQAVIWKNGELSYVINNKYVPASKIKKALELLQQNSQAFLDSKKFKKEYEEYMKEMGEFYESQGKDSQATS